MANAICRSCGNDDVDPNTGSYELCEACWDVFVDENDTWLADLDEWDSCFLAANPEFDDCPF